MNTPIPPQTFPVPRFYIGQKVKCVTGGLCSGRVAAISILFSPVPVYDLFCDGNIVAAYGVPEGDLVAE